MGTQLLVGAAGASLVAAEFWFTPADRDAVTTGIFGSGDPAGAHSALKKIGVEALFVIGATVIAGASDAWGMAMLVVIVALAVLWSIQHQGDLAKIKNTGAGIAQATGKGTS